MNLTKLRHVVAVERTGSITKAAELMNVTQSAVTKSVAEVEREIGYALFIRQARGVAATEMGGTFIVRAARILADMDQLIEDAQAGRQQREALLRVGISPPSLEGLLNRAVRFLIRKYPDYRVQLRGVSIERGIQLLRQGDLDICLGPLDRLSADGGFKCESLGTLSGRLFVRKAHPLTRLAQPGADDIGRFPLIAPDLSGDYIARLLALVPAEQGPPSLRVHILENFPMVTDIVGSTDTVGVVSAGYAQTRAFRAQFAVLPYDLGDPMPIAAASRREWLPTRPMMHFMAAIQAHPPTGYPTGYGRRTPPGRTAEGEPEPAPGLPG